MARDCQLGHSDVNDFIKAKICPTTRHEGVWVERRYLLLILNLGTR
jgi:hypothetical protein